MGKFTFFLILLAAVFFVAVGSQLGEGLSEAGKTRAAAKAAVDYARASQLRAEADLQILRNRDEEALLAATLADRAQAERQRLLAFTLGVGILSVGGSTAFAVFAIAFAILRSRRVMLEATAPFVVARGDLTVVQIPGKPAVTLSYHNYHPVPTVVIGDKVRITKVSPEVVVAIAGARSKEEISRISFNALVKAKTMEERRDILMSLMDLARQLGQNPKPILDGAVLANRQVPPDNDN